MREVWILEALRSPMGRYGGALCDIRPDDLAALVIKSLLEKTGIDGKHIDDVYFGCANQAGEDNRNIARMATLLSGLPYEVPGVTINRLCASSLDAINLAAHAIAINEADLIIAGGVETMSRAPFVLGKPTEAFPRGNMQIYDTTLGWRFPNPKMEKMFPLYSMGETAEEVATLKKISRQEQDVYAFKSQQRWQQARDQKKWIEEIVPVPKEKMLISQDEHPRPETTLEKLTALKPCFRPNGSVTAGNSSGINDGAAAVLLASTTKALDMGFKKPYGRWVASATVGVHPNMMGLGPIHAVRKLFERAKIKISDLDLIEVNEAFAATTLAVIQELKFPPDKTNVNGGAIALGHPLGASGARIMTTLVHEMRRRGSHFGLATMCVGVGQGVATLIEAL